MNEIVLTLIIFLFPLAYSPGPGNMLFAIWGAEFGWRATLGANIGYHLLTWFVTFAIGLGFFELFTFMPLISLIVKTVGAIYLGAIAWQMWGQGVTEASTARCPPRFTDGALLLLCNPKAYLIIAVMFAQFLPDLAQRDMLAILLITTIFTLNNLMAFLLWTGAGDFLMRVLSNTVFATYINRLLALLICAVALWLITT